MEIYRDIDFGQVYEVKDILEHKSGPLHSDLFFLILWMDGTTTWEPSRNLTNCNQIIRDYMKKFMVNEKDVKEICNWRENNNRTEYLVRWKDNLKKKDSWKSESSLHFCDDALKKFLRK